MIFLFVLLLSGSLYLYYRYKSASNKKKFFRSPFFLSVAGSLSILFVSVVIVNTFAPEKIQQVNHIPSIDSLLKDEPDTSYYHLRQRDAPYHYHLIKKFQFNPEYAGHMVGLQSAYSRLSVQSDTVTSSLGNFALGVIHMDIDRQQALEYFHSVSDQRLPYLHFCLGEVLLKENKNAAAEEEYLRELQSDKGNIAGAYHTLLDLYNKANNYDKLYQLMQYPWADEYFPEYLGRVVALHAFDIKKYVGWLMRLLTNRINSIGFIAAVLISIIWLVYLFRLDIFKPEKVLSLVLMFFSGAACVFLVFPISDWLELLTHWHLTDNFFNDAAYCILMIGVPEEFVKVLPLLVMLPFLSKGLKEPIDYIIYASASALGFALVENLLYFQEINHGIIHGRAYLSAVGHMVNTSLVAYGFVISKFRIRKKKSLWHTLPLSFLLACIVHGIYDVLIFHRLTFLFLIFFIFIVQCWIVVINNCMNNSAHFSYRFVFRAEKSRLFITLGLIAIFAFEYLAVSFSFGPTQGNNQLLWNSMFAGFFIGFFSSNLSSFDLIKGYWRSIRFVRSQKGMRRRSLHPFINWYFVNAINPHNYVGLTVNIYNDRYNKTLQEVLQDNYTGRIINRIILYENDTPDPHWFLIKLLNPIPFSTDRPDYILVKVRYQEDSLLQDNAVQVFFKAITDARDLYHAQPQKDKFPFYGWAYISLV